MRPKHLAVALLFVLCVSVGVSLNAQVNQSATSQSTSAPPEEKKVGEYFASGSVEAGYRFVDVTGAQYPCALNAGGTTPGTFPAISTCNFTGLWDTFEDLRQGPRVLEQTLSLRSAGQTGVLFDNLFVSSFGWGGDPENVARLRVGKRKAYDLAVLFRRDYQRFDFNLLANPLNPAASTPSIQIYNSPHNFDTVRRMTDVNLTLAPTSPISVRLGFNRNRVGGDSWTTFHMPRGTDINPPMGWNVTNNGFRAGVDLKLVPRTTLSFDGNVDWFKNDSALDTPYLFWNIGGVPANLGISWNTFLTPPRPAPQSPGQPCAFLLVGTAACNLDFSFFRQDRVRSTMRNVMASLESRYWQRVDLSARVVYGWADLDSTYNQIWNGLVGVTPPALPPRQEQVIVVPHNRRVTTSTDLGATIHLTDHIRFSDTFRFVNQRMPLTGTTVDTLWRATSTVLPASTPIGAPEVAVTGLDQGLFIDTKLNESMLEFDLGRYAGVNVGYRYTHRIIQQNGEGFDIDPATGERDFATEAESGFDRFVIPQHTAIGGLYIRPSEKFRLNFDAELSSAGIDYKTLAEDGTFVSFTGITTFTRITPRHDQQYRARATALPMRHVSLSGTLNILEQRNSLQDIQYRMHNRNYGFSADISPNDRILLDLAYNYQDFLQNDLICFVYGAAGAITPGTYAGILSPGVCTQSGGLPADTSYLGTSGHYGSQVHFGSAMLRVKPVKRVTASVGYSIISTDGSFTNTNALQPFSPVQYNYHRPLAALEIELAGGLALKGGFNYYGYNEKAGSRADVPFSGGPTAPRDFHANTGTIALRYSF